MGVLGFPSRIDLLYNIDAGIVGVNCMYGFMLEFDIKDTRQPEQAPCA